LSIGGDIIIESTQLTNTARLKTSAKDEVIVVTSDLDHIKTFVKEMSWAELQNTVLRLAEQNEPVRAALQQIWREHERGIRLKKSVEWEPADWIEARKHFEPIIQDELKQCVELFIDRYEYGSPSYDSDDGRYDFTEGLDQLDRWFAELLEMAADGEWIDASVGLLLTLERLDDWAIENGDEDIGGEDLQEECSSFWNKAEELTAIIRGSTAPDPNKSAFFLELIDWVGGFTEEEDWSSWKELLSSCLFSAEHYERLTEHVKRLEPGLFAVDHTAEKPVELDVLRWWVQSSLDAGCETEAQRAEARLTAFDAQTSACFAHYYERLDRTEEAVARLQFIIRHTQEQIQRKSSGSLGMVHSQYVSEQQANHYFERLVAIYERTNRQADAESWRIQWFETLPSLELFRLCLRAVPSDQRERQAEKWIAHVRRQGGYRFNDLLIDMYLHIGDPDGAWSVYLEKSQVSDWLSETARRLFEVIKHHDPGRLVPVLRQYAEQRIAEKNRKSYQRVAEWLAELKSVYHLLDQSEVWTAYLREVKENHRRLLALQDELAKAKL
jgi:hypothetical protein